jgi:hypothetical protein
MKKLFFVLIKEQCPLVRIIAVLLSLSGFYGAYIVYKYELTNKLTYNHSFQAFIAMIAFGIFWMIVAFKGRFSLRRGG